MEYSGRDELSNRSYQANGFSDKSGPSASSSSRYYSTPSQHDSYCKPGDYFQQRANTSFYGGSYQENYKSSQQQYSSAMTSSPNRYIDPNSAAGDYSRRQQKKKKKRSGRSKKTVEEPDDDVHLKENGEWDADFHFFGVESPRSRTVRASELPDSTWRTK